MLLQVYTIRQRQSRAKPGNIEILRSGTAADFAALISYREMKNYQAALSTYQFKRAKADGLIQVFNEGCYLMAEYNERTGIVSWQRVLLATQREMVEKWLRERYPMRRAAPPAPVQPVRTRPARPVAKAGRSRSAAQG